MAILYQYPEYYSWFIENLYLVIFYHFFPVVCLPNLHILPSKEENWSSGRVNEG